MSYPRFSGYPASAYSPMPANIAQRYQEDQVYTMSPIQLLVKVYDIAIEACNRQDRKRASKAIVELIGALDFEYKEIADRFLGIYEYCMGRVRAGEYHEARELLQDLRDGWVEASQTNGQQTAAPAAAPTSRLSIQTEA